VSQAEPYRPHPIDRLFDLAELVRLPNVFTAVADVLMGFLFVRMFSTDDGPLLCWLVAASALLYAAGTTLNDVFDYVRDLEERPERPLPSGRIRRGTAAAIGWGLLACGVASAGAAAYCAQSWRPAIVGALLAGAIVFYDVFLKRTFLGPLGMGACRMLNVLLGMSVLTAAWAVPSYWVAGAIGLYVVGITWFARDEAGQSSRVQLASALVVMLSGLGMLAALAVILPDNSKEVQLPVAGQAVAISELAMEAQWPIQLPIHRMGDRWFVLIGALAILSAWRCLRAVAQPQARLVRQAVGQAILALVILDAAACFAIRDTAGSIAIALLLVPTMLLSQLLPST
jgi:4-hydroxybenzoate polyprenyltransferase